MRIKESKRLIETVIIEYISDDGKRFKTERECVAYENLRDAIKKEFVKIQTKPEAANLMNIDGQEHYCDANYDWYFPKNEHEIAILKEYYADPDAAFNHNCIGKWICVEDGEWATGISTLEDGIEHAKKLLNMFGYDVVKMEEK